MTDGKRLLLSDKLLEEKFTSLLGSIDLTEKRSGLCQGQAPERRLFG
jgi:hypothetical protein